MIETAFARWDKSPANMAKVVIAFVDLGGVHGLDSHPSLEGTAAKPMGTAFFRMGHSPFLGFGAPFVSVIRVVMALPFALYVSVGFVVFALAFERLLMVDFVVFVIAFERLLAVSEVPFTRTFTLLITVGGSVFPLVLVYPLWMLRAVAARIFSPFLQGGIVREKSGVAKCGRLRIHRGPPFLGVTQPDSIHCRGCTYSTTRYS